MVERRKGRLRDKWNRDGAQVGRTRSRDGNSHGGSLRLRRD